MNNTDAHLHVWRNSSDPALSNGTVSASRTFTFTVQGTPAQTWWQQYFGNTTGIGIAADLTYTVEVSGDLQSPWQSGPAHTTILTDTPTLLRVRDNTPWNSSTRRFIRLRVSQ